MRRHNPKIVAILFCLAFLVAAILISPKQYNAYTKTSVDLTGLVAGDGTNHTHIYEEKNDTQYHWQECFICGKIENRGKHTKQTYGNTTSCNVRVYGYGYEYCTNPLCSYDVMLDPIPHVPVAEWSVNTANAFHSKQCKNCSYNATGNIHCQDSKGRNLGCAITGTCVTCGTKYTDTNHGQIIDGKCNRCDTEGFATYTLTSTIININTTRFYWTVKPISGMTLDVDNFNWSSTTGAEAKALMTPSNLKLTKSGNTYYFQGDISIDAAARATGFNFNMSTTYTYNGYSGKFNLYAFPMADNYAPYKSSVSVSGQGTKDKFSQKATVKAVYKDDWVSDNNNVQMRLLETDGSSMTEWLTSTRNGTQYTSEMDIVAEIREPSIITLEVKDAAGHEVSEKVSVQYIDALAPRMTSSDEFIGEWSKTKDVTFKAIDLGIGQVSIAFNDTSDYQPAEQIDMDNWQRTYTFYGDVYDYVTGALYLKDGLGNERTEKVRIGKLDGTAPSITSASKSGLKADKTVDIYVNANDLHPTLGLGSGINGYAITKSDTAPDVSAFKSSTAETYTFTVSENGTYYIWVTDLVGNISAPVKMVVNEITAKVKYIDRFDDGKDEIVKEEKLVNIGNVVRGADMGSETAENRYYDGYHYGGDSGEVVVDIEDSTGYGAVVYRNFVRTLYGGDGVISGSVNWVDQSNKYNSRPENVTITLKQNENLSVDHITGGKAGSSAMSTTDVCNKDKNDFSFVGLPKYSRSGELYTYSVTQSDVKSNNADDTYVTSSAGFVFTNTLKNNNDPAEDPEPIVPEDPDAPNIERIGYTVDGSVLWGDNSDSLGLRPLVNTIVLEKKIGDMYEYVASADISKLSGKDSYNFLFTNLPKYVYNDDETVKEAIEYRVRQEYIAYVIENGEVKDAYSETHDVQNDATTDLPCRYNFVNTLNSFSGTITTLPEYTNVLVVRHNAEENITVILRQMQETVENGKIEYLDIYADNLYNIDVSPAGRVLNKFTAGKYELEVISKDYDLMSVNTGTQTDASVVYENGKYWLTVGSVPRNVMATLELTLEKKDHVGMQTEVDANNIWEIEASLSK